MPLAFKAPIKNTIKTIYISFMPANVKPRQLPRGPPGRPTSVGILSNFRGRLGQAALGSCAQGHSWCSPLRLECCSCKTFGVSKGPACPYGCPGLLCHPSQMPPSWQQPLSPVSRSAHQTRKAWRLPIRLREAEGEQEEGEQERPAEPLAVGQTGAVPKRAQADAFPRPFCSAPPPSCSGGFQGGSSARGLLRPPPGQWLLRCLAQPDPGAAEARPKSSCPGSILQACPGRGCCAGGLSRTEGG